MWRDQMPQCTAKLASRHDNDDTTTVTTNCDYYGDDTAQCHNTQQSSVHIWLPSVASASNVRIWLASAAVESGCASAAELPGVVQGSSIGELVLCPKAIFKACVS